MQILPALNKYEKCRPPILQEDLPLHHTSTPFLKFFRIPPLGEVIKIYSPPPIKREGGPNVMLLFYMDSIYLLNLVSQLHFC